ncbi:YceI family protein [Aureivirga sp. CE67]|uniref:YceI family protein n=1 Tax=Aureivirga sp. CE67 TaxID=1788983 RepID=UPI0018CA620D|nr:YceI family protein [Aureivirga sp. CE67]
MRLFLILTFFLGIQNSIFSQQIDTNKSKMQFEISNMGGLKTVEGNFSEISGEIITEIGTLVKIDFCLNASSINTENKKRDKHLKNQDFFEVEKYPNICFTSTSIIKQENSYLVKGNLTIKNITKQIEILVSFDGKTLENTDDFILKRYDFGVGSKGGFMVGKEVKFTNIEIHLN